MLFLQAKRALTINIKINSKKATLLALLEKKSLFWQAFFSWTTFIISTVLLGGGKRRRCTGAEPFLCYTDVPPEHESLPSSFCPCSFASLLFPGYTAFSRHGLAPEKKSKNSFNPLISTFRNLPTPFLHFGRLMTFLFANYGPPLGPSITAKIGLSSLPMPGTAYLHPRSVSSASRDKCLIELLC